jgi:hypothetical protein
MAWLRHLWHWCFWMGGWIRPRRPGLPWFQPTPVALFGHRLCFLGWGMHLRLGAQYLVLVWGDHSAETLPRFYLSPNGTPWAATRWFLGKPREVKQ